MSVIPQQPIQLRNHQVKLHTIQKRTQGKKQNAHTCSRMQTIINKISIEGTTMAEMTLVINLAQAFQAEVDLDAESSEDEDSEQDEQAIVNKSYNPIEAEPQPPQESPYPHATIDEQQGLDDVMHSATTDINELYHTNVALQKHTVYKVFIRKLKKELFNLQLLQAKLHALPLPTPNNHPLHISTPKSHTTINILYDTT